MKPHSKLPCSILATVLAAALQLTTHAAAQQLAAHAAAVPLAWEARPGNPAPAQFTRYHGETLSLRCTLAGFDGDLSAQGDVRLWFQTNGMGRLWWSAPATAASNRIEAAFGAAEDVGADRVSLFLGSPSNVYASAVLRLMPSPGFTPADLSLPVLRLDFSALAVTNAPYYTKAETDAKIVELAPAPGNYAAVSNAAMNALQKSGAKMQAGASIQWGEGIEMGEDAPGLYIYNRENGGYWLFYDYPDGNMVARLRNIPPAVSNVVTKSYVENLGISSEVDETDPVWSTDKPNYATKTELGSVSETANAAALDAASALRIVLGERVWFAVTNHMRTAEGVIPSLQLWEVRDSVTNLVYDSREEITNTVKALTRELHTELTNRIHDAEKTIPSKAWGNYQSDGTDNPEPGKVAIINQPTVILTGGGTFNKYVEIGDSSIWVLTSSGPVSFGGGGTNGNYFAVLDDEGNAHFKVSKTDSFDVGAIFTDNPRTSGDALLLYICSTNRQGEAYIGPPTLSACTNLQAAVWHDEADGEIDALGTSVAWARNDAIHAWVGTVTQDRWATAMYFRAKMKQEGGTAIINTAPVRFDGGIQLGNGKYRLVPYTTGGKTYLTVEGLQ